VPHAGWTAARRAILQAFATGEHLVALLGPPGVGKTCLLREIELALRPQAIRVLRLESGDVAEGVLAAAPDTEVLLIDEADRMSEAVLEEVAEREGCFAVVVGLPPLSRRLAPWPHRIVELPPIPEAETRSYLAARMIIAELDAARLTDGAAAALAELSEGTPRLLNLLLAMAFHEADMTGQRDVLSMHVREAAALRAEAPEGRPGTLPGTDPAGAAPSAPPKGSPNDSTEIVSPAAARPSSSLALTLPADRERPARSRLPAVVVAAAGIIVVGGLTWLALHEDWLAAGRRLLPSPPSGTPASEAAPGPVLAGAPTASAGTMAPGPATAETSAVGNPAGAAPPSLGQSPGTLPAGAMVRVVVTYPRGVPEAGRRAAALSATLAQAGVSVGAPFPVSRPSPGAALSYFFREDRDAALRVARLGGLDAAVPELGPVGGAAPRPGTIEVALAAPGAAAEEREPAPPRDQEPSPPAAILVNPAEGAALPADAAWRGVVLSWTTPAEPRPGCCFIEVVSLGGTPGDSEPGMREAFAAYSEIPDQQSVQLSGPGRYAWRVLTVSRAGRRYAASPWRHFAISGAPS